MAGLPPSCGSTTRQRTVRVTVSDHGASGEPAVLDAATDMGHGRGMAMVQALADEVGWHRDGDRLDVWAEFPIS